MKNPLGNNVTVDLRNELQKMEYGTLNCDLQNVASSSWLHRVGL